jgi:hypothetical protein
MEFGEPNALAGGGTLVPLDVRFYVSKVNLVRSDETTIAADIVTESGMPVPYGVHLVNAEDAASLRFRVLAPPGSYSGAMFTLGVGDECNGGPFDRAEPLSNTSTMVWPHVGGYLFLRYAGSVTAGSEGALPPDAGSPDAGSPELPPGAIHMGGLPTLLLAPIVRAPGSITLAPNTPSSMRLVMNFDEIFRAATSDLDVSDYPVETHPEVLLGEKVRRLAPELSLFALLPP